MAAPPSTAICRALISVTDDQTADRSVNCGRNQKRTAPASTSEKTGPISRRQSGRLGRGVGSGAWGGVWWGVGCGSGAPPPGVVSGPPPLVLVPLLLQVGPGDHADDLGGQG